MLGQCGAGCRKPAACLNEYCRHLDCLYYIGLGKNGRLGSALPGSVELKCPPVVSRGLCYVYYG